MINITAADLRKLCPKGKVAAQNTFAAAWPDLAAAYSIDTALRTEHFWAQIAHESDGMKAMEEYASGAAYEGRADLGNTQRGDGKRFKGRGPFQLTGRANYAAMSKKLGLDLIGHPALAAQPDIGLRIACEFWTSRKLNALADQDDIRGITKKINGGYNGLADRQQYLAKAKKIWPASADKAVPLVAAVPAAPPAQAAETPAQAPVAPADAITDDKSVRIVQQMLKNIGYAETGEVDGKLGDWTKTAIRAFRAENGMPPGDWIDKDLITAIVAADTRPVAAARRSATAADVREKVPEVKASWRTKIAGLWGSIVAGVVALVQGAGDKFQSVKEQIEPVQGYLSDVPGWAWLALIAAGAAGVYLVGKQGEQAGVESFKSGARR